MCADVCLPPGSIAPPTCSTKGEMGVQGDFSAHAFRVMIREFEPYAEALHHASRKISESNLCRVHLERWSQKC